MTTERKSLTLQYRLLKVCHVVLVVFFLGYLFAAGSLFCLVSLYQRASTIRLLPLSDSDKVRQKGIDYPYSLSANLTLRCKDTNFIEKKQINQLLILVVYLQYIIFNKACN